MDRWRVKKQRKCKNILVSHGNCIWSSFKGRQKITMGKQIFCNRSLNMKGIVAVGFDMDYTLAQYKPETFETLAYNGTVRKLVYDLGYPPELLEWSFEWKYMVRGLVLDKKRGNILKVSLLFNEAVRMSPEDADVHIVLGVLYNLYREYDKGISSFQQALKLKPRDYSLWNKLGATQANSKQCSKC